MFLLATPGVPPSSDEEGRQLQSAYSTSSCDCTWALQLDRGCVGDGTICGDHWYYREPFSWPIIGFTYRTEHYNRDRQGDD